MKPTENYEQLLERFDKRTEQLVDRLQELQDAHYEYENSHKEWKFHNDLTRHPWCGCLLLKFCLHSLRHQRL